MPELQYAEPTIFAPRAMAADPLTEALTEALLDSSSLHTVLEMLTVIESTEELAMLETLTPAQKRQVWDATPDVVKARVKQIRLNAVLPPAETVCQESISEAGLGAALQAHPEPPTWSEADSSEADSDDSLDAAELDLDEVAISRELELPPVLAEQLAEQLEAGLTSSAPSAFTPAALTLKVGDWVVLKAVPKLTNAELKAIWEVTEVQDTYAQIATRGLGTRIYPLDWMLFYPKPAEGR